MLSKVIAWVRPSGATVASLPNDRWNLLEVAFWVAPVAAYILFPGYLVLGNQIFVTALLAVSLDLVLGYAGIVSLGHAAFFGLGAYTAGLLALHGWGEPLTGLLAGGVVASAVGFLVSFLVVRGNDLARLMVTLGISLVLYEAANQASSVTGGVDGLGGITIWKVFGLFPFGFNGRTSYIYSLVVLLVVFVVMRRIVNSPFGLALRGLREGAARMPALGVSVRSLQVTAFTLAAGIAGVAGALLTQTTQFVGLDVLGFPRSAELLIMLVFGGAGTLYGAVVGATVFMVAQEILSGLNHLYWQFWLGLMLVVIVLFFRGGIMGGLERLSALRRRRKP